MARFLAVVMLVSGQALIPGVIDSAGAATGRELTVVVHSRTEGPAGVWTNQVSGPTDWAYALHIDDAGNNEDASTANDVFQETLPSYAPLAVSDTITGSSSALVPLPDGVDEYVLTVTSEGFRTGGRPFMVDIDGDLIDRVSTVNGDAGSQVLNVYLVEEPLPLGRIVVQLFEDSALTNGEYDNPAEPVIPDPDRAGFQTFIHAGGVVGVDWFGNPLCTNYVTDTGAPGAYDQTGVLLDINSDPVKTSGLDPVIDAVAPGGACRFDADGFLNINHIPRGKYEVEVVPPNGSGWVQTTTIEGTVIIDAWTIEGADGFVREEVETVPSAQFGFVQECTLLDPTDRCSDNYAAEELEDFDVPGAGSVTGTARFFPWEVVQPFGPEPFGEPLQYPWVAINDMRNDRQIALVQGNADGTFEVTDLPDGPYQVVIWDDPLLSFVQIEPFEIVAGGAVAMGDIAVGRWRGWLSGTVWLDDNRDGVKDGGEIGMPGEEVCVRQRDGVVLGCAVTNIFGEYEMEQLFPFGRMQVAEVGFGRRGFTSAISTDEFGTMTTQDGALTVAMMTSFGRRNVVDWGKYTYEAEETGGISGVVFNTLTRNEFDAALQAPEDYEPGVPSVELQLWTVHPVGFVPHASAVTKVNPADPTERLVLVQIGETDAYGHPTGCTYLDAAGDPLADPLGIGPNCIESPQLRAQIAEAVFDGGYAFEEYYIEGLDALGDPVGGAVLDVLIPGEYVVEVVPPAFMKIVTEADLNTATGNDLIPQFPQGPCAGDEEMMLIPDVYGSPYDDQLRRKCDLRRVTLDAQVNAAADFHLMNVDAVPMPSRVNGILLDDLNFTADVNDYMFGDKVGVPNTPIGIRDFTGQLIAVVHSDEMGQYSTLLPATNVADCPTPAGVCPAIYELFANDPGSIAWPNDNFNGAYQSLVVHRDFWSGTMTLADTALFLATADAGIPNTTGPTTPFECFTDVPELAFVDDLVVADGAVERITITGKQFGASPGSIIVDGTPIAPFSWSDTVIEVDLDADALGAAITGGGALQLLVEDANGVRGFNGITMHILDAAAYDPVIWIVSPPVTFDPPTFPIQDTIEAASDGDVILVEPGVYRELLVIGNNVKLQGYGPGDVPFGTGGALGSRRSSELTTLSVHVEQLRSPSSTQALVCLCLDLATTSSRSSKRAASPSLANTSLDQAVKSRHTSMDGTLASTPRLTVSGSPEAVPRVQEASTSTPMPRA